MELNTIVSEVGTLVDIRDVSVNKELSRAERIAEFVQQIKNPYHFKCGRFTVQASFSAEGATLEECIKDGGLNGKKKQKTDGGTYAGTIFICTCSSVYPSFCGG